MNCMRKFIYSKLGTFASRFSLGRRLHSQLKNEKGFSLVEVLVAIGISGLVILGTSSIFVDSAKTEAGQARQLWIADRRMEFQGLIRSATSWNTVLDNNPSMACIKTGTSCAAFSNLQPLKLTVDNIVLDGASNTTGMTNKGTFCNTFDSVNGNSSCPVGIRLNWVALCDDANCLHAQPKIIVKFQIKEASATLQDLKSQDLVIFKDPKLESLNQVCAAMGGSLVGTVCSIDSLASKCDPSNSKGLGATYPLSFDNTGVVFCGKPDPGSCAASDVATGFDANGGISCTKACL